jgi:hypothetical protein
VLKVEQTLTCDICGKKMNSLTQVVYPGTAMQMIARGPAGMTQWHDICTECHGSVVKALQAVKVLETVSAEAAKAK